MTEKESFEIEQKLDTIYNTFGLENQLAHLKTEELEYKKAKKIYIDNPTKENFNNMLEEKIDELNVLLGISVGLYSQKVTDATRIGYEKINRTVDIIGRMDKTKEPVGEYERIRRGK